jgi:hypothetical protein
MGITAASMAGTAGGTTAGGCAREVVEEQAVEASSSPASSERRMRWERSMGDMTDSPEAGR